ncbi:MAG: ABC transporter ATP-binding protein/permease [Candidatus Pacebacteria bacterium]|nr:ABC transporter ATP-binding protein/permease [Candidatus Paceibacterota bacterium]
MDKHFRHTISLLLSTFKKRFRLFIGFLIINIILSLINVIFPYFLKLQIDFLQNQSFQLPFTNNTLSIFLVLLLVPAIFELSRLSFFQRIERKVSQSFTYKLRKDLEKLIWEKMKKFDLGFFEAGRNQHLIRTSFSSIYVFDRITQFIREQFNSIITFVAIIPLLYFINYKILILIIIASFLQFFLREVRTKLELGQQFVSTYIEGKAFVIQELMRNNFGLVKEIGASEQVIDQYFKEQDKTEKLILEKELHNKSSRVLDWFIENVFFILANLFVAQQVFSGKVSIGTFTLTISYINQIRHSFEDFFSFKSRWKSISVELLKMSFILNLESRLKTTKDNLKVSFPQKLELKNVGFTYPSFYEDEKKFINNIVDDITNNSRRGQSEFVQRELDEWHSLLETPSKNKSVLNNVNLEVNKGKITALLGRNGSGKTTITRLLMHSYEADEGQVLIDDQLINKFDLEEVSQSVAYLQQSPFIVDRMSIKDNLLLGVKRKVTNKEIWEVLAKLQIKYLVTKLNKGLNSVLGEDTNFSGGQKQLLVIARALLQKRPFIIFDEGSSQLDIEKENMILKVLDSIKSEVGILFITHRITVAKKADYIYFLDKGKIKEEGTHQELIKKEGLYHRFWKLQVIE